MKREENIENKGKKYQKKKKKKMKRKKKTEDLLGKASERK